MTVDMRKKNLKVGGINKPLGLHNSFSQKILTRAIFLLDPAVNIFGKIQNFYQLHDMAACCYLEDDLRNRLDHNFPSRSADGTSHSSSDLLYSSLLLLFTWTNYSKSNTNSKKKHFKTISFLVLVAEFLHFYKIILNPTFFLCTKNSLFLLTYSTRLPLESKQCPLTVASVLACADSVEELRF